MDLKAEKIEEKPHIYYKINKKKLFELIGIEAEDVNCIDLNGSTEFDNDIEIHMR